MYYIHKSQFNVLVLYYADILYPYTRYIQAHVHIYPC